MIVEFLMNVGASIAAWVMSLLPDLDWVDGMTMTASNGLASFMVAAGQLSPWFPWATLAICMTGVLGAYFLLFLAKISRQLIAHIPLFGGSG